MANATFPAVTRNADRVKRGDGLIAAEFTAQDTGEGKANQHATAESAYMHKIFRLPFGMGQPLFEETAARLTDVTRIDGDDLLKIAGS
jgi:hypothetical protein